MRIERAIPLTSIVVDREPIGPRTLALVDHLRAKGTSNLPPIHVQRLTEGRFKILDGRHRVLAYKLLGWSYIKARYGIPQGQNPTTEELPPVVRNSVLFPKTEKWTVEQTTHLQE